MNRNLKEGMRSGDLDDLILPMLSIDEYVSKISDDKDVIVIGFFVEDEDPANDLSRFIDRSVADILDTDVSPAPNEEGYFLVFLEIKRDNKVVKTLLKVLDEIENLVNISEWTFKVYNDKTIHKLNKETLNAKVNVSQISFESFEITNFLKESTLDGYTIYKDQITFEKRGMTQKYTLVTFNKILIDRGINADLKSISECHRLQAWLGGLWTVSKCDGVFILSRYDSEKTLILKS